MLLTPLLVSFLSLTTVFGQEEVTSRPALNSTEGHAGDIDAEHMALYKKIHKYLIRTKEYKDYTFEDTIKHVNEGDDWVAPKELQQELPYYLAGYDKDNQPVWVMEIGKFNIRKQVEKGPEGERNVTLYLFQAVHRVFRSMIAKDTDENEIKGVFVLGDCEGLDLIQTAHVPTIKYLLSVLSSYNDMIGLLVSDGIFFNMNYVTTVLFNSFRPILGGVFDRVDFYGSNKEKWMPALQKALPIETIPTWYGGEKGYKPLEIYG